MCEDILTKKEVEKLKRLYKIKREKNIVSLRGKIIKKWVYGKNLDVGCNSLFLHEEIKNKNTFGIDLLIDVSKFGNKRYIKGDAQSLPIKDAVFDTVIAGELIEHLNKPEKFVKEAYRILNQGGLLIITTPNKKSWWNRITKSYHHKFHKKVFEIKELTHILKNNNFHIVYFDVIPYDIWTSSFGMFFSVRKYINYILPKNLRENIIIIVKK